MPITNKNTSATTIKPQKELLNNVLVIRPILVLLLVFYHAFAIYGGNWEQIAGFSEIKAYWWLDKLSYAFMLELFVFVSGYVFGYQVRINGESKLEAKSLFWGKFKRLMIPCMLFSLLYIILFGDITQPVTNTLYLLLIGAGHMWFLPMLYCCFVGVWLIEKSHIKSSWAIPLLVVVSLMHYYGLPLRLGFTMYYLVFFYIGYTIQKNNIKISNNYTLRYVILGVLLFVLSFVGLTLFRENIQVFFSNKSIYVQGLKFVTNNLCQIIYSGIGVLMVIITVGYLQKQTNRKPAQWVVSVGNLCFGVYLLQQFILKGLYYYTSLPMICGEYLLPWIGFVIALTGSLVLAWFIRLFRVGRLII